MAYESTKQDYKVVIHLHTEVTAGERIPGTKIRETLEGTRTIKGSRSRAKFLSGIVKEGRLVSVVGEDGLVVETL